LSVFYIISQLNYNDSTDKTLNFVPAKKIDTMVPAKLPPPGEQKNQVPSQPRTPQECKKEVILTEHRKEYENDALLTELLGLEPTNVDSSLKSARSSLENIMNLPDELNELIALEEVCEVKPPAVASVSTETQKQLALIENELKQPGMDFLVHSPQPLTPSETSGNILQKIINNTVSNTISTVQQVLPSMASRKRIQKLFEAKQKEVFPLHRAGSIDTVSALRYEVRPDAPSRSLSIPTIAIDTPSKYDFPKNYSNNSDPPSPQLSEKVAFNLCREKSNFG
jgi:hypothetical protein